MSQVIRPMTPYRGPIPGGLYEGKLIEFRGHIPYGANKFSINLVTGLDSYSDHPLHISVRMSERSVVRNSLWRQEWQNEEKHGAFPFHSGRDFTIMISVDSACYRIAVDGQHQWEFVHRLPLERVTSLYVDGDVKIERIEYIDKFSQYQPGGCNPPTVFPSAYEQPAGCVPPPMYPSGGMVPIPSIPSLPTVNPGICVYPSQVIAPPEKQICPPASYVTSSSNLAPVYNPTIPYAYPIYGGLHHGMMVYISGRPTGSPYRFTLNFQDGTTAYPPPDIAFHFDVRFSNSTIVRNSRLNNSWEREESLISHFPFAPGVNFDMIIRIEGNKFMIAVNGQHFLEFTNRLQPISRFDTLYIENDIIVSSIRFA